MHVWKLLCEVIQLNLFVHTYSQAGLALIDVAHYAIAEIESKMTTLAAHWQLLMAKYVSICVCVCVRVYVCILISILVHVYFRTFKHKYSCV